ncbi:MAG TPA: AMP-binding protein, partial [Rhizobacter sp.]|nr:AMP-binding protein [Rhizobacter sp.]
PEAKVFICAADLAALVEQANSSLPAEQRLAQVLVTRYADAMAAPGAGDPEVAPSAPLEAWLRADPPLPAPAAGGATYLRWNEVLAQKRQPDPHTAQPDDLAVLPYTSGTTGNPKGCMHTHRTVMHNTCGIQWAHGGPEAVGLGVVPMFHITGMVGMSAAVYAGSTVVLMPRWDREAVGRAISRYQVTHWTCIPTMVIDLFGSPNYKSFDLSSLRFLNGGGASMPAAVAERLEKEFGIVFAEGYGLTETSAATHGNPPERGKPQCLGIPIFNVDSRVIDPTTLKELPPGEIGEIISRGPQVFKGYWRQPDATAAVFIEFEGKTFFRTGDLGRMDEEGYFYITDRLKRMINASGFKVWPAEVEMLLYKHPAVQEACIIAARDAYRGETVKAVVVLRAEAKGKTTEQDIIDWARDHMAAYKVPKIVQFADVLPKSGSGKVMWRLLQDAEAK